MLYFARTGLVTRCYMPRRTNYRRRNKNALKQKFNTNNKTQTHMSKNDSKFPLSAFDALSDWQKQDDGRCVLVMAGTKEDSLFSMVGNSLILETTIASQIIDVNDFRETLMKAFALASVATTDDDLVKNADDAKDDK